jgi:hypothetical protein
MTYASSSTHALQSLLLPGEEIRQTGLQNRMEHIKARMQGQDPHMSQAYASKSRTCSPFSSRKPGFDTV